MGKGISNSQQSPTAAHRAASKTRTRSHSLRFISNSKMYSETLLATSKLAQPDPIMKTPTCAAMRRVGEKMSNPFLVMQISP